MAGQRTPGPTGIDTRATARIDPGTRALTATPPPGGVGGTPESGLGGPVYTLDRHDLGWLDTREAAGALWDALSQSRRHVAAIVRQETGVILDEIIDGILPALAMAVGVLAASAVLGAAVGAALGALAGGVGAAPGAVAGGQAGFAVGMAAMEWLGLGFLAVAVVGALGRVGDYAGRATRRAVNSLFVPTTQQPGEILLAAQDYSRAQAELLKAVLVGLVALLLKNSALNATRQAGAGVADLVAMLRSSRLGEGFAAWVEANWTRLIANPRLRPAIPESAASKPNAQAVTPSQLLRRQAEPTENPMPPRAQQVTRTTPSGPPNSKPTGRRTLIRSQDDAATQRSLQRENESADLLAKNGYRVEQNPITSDGKNPDYLIEGYRFDNKAPTTTRPRNAASEIEKAVRLGQADRIVLNLEDSPITLQAMADQLNQYPIAGLKEVIVVKDGVVLPFWP